MGFKESQITQTAHSNEQISNYAISSGGSLKVYSGVVRDLNWATQEPRY